MTPRLGPVRCARRPVVLRAVALLFAAALTTLLTLGGGQSMSAFTGSITNGANSIRSALWTCQATELADSPIRMYSLASTGGGTNQGSAGSGTDATFVGSALGSGFASGGGCRRDAQTYYTTTPALSGILARWVSTAGTTSIAAGSVLTQEIWVRTSVAKGQLMGFGDNGTTANGSSQKGLQVFFTATGRLDFATYQNSTNQELLSPAGTSYADGAWHHVVAVYNAGAKQLYVDGVLVASGTGPSETIARAYWRLGNDSFTGWTNAPTGTNATYLDGGLQYAALYTKALTAAQVQAHYRAGLPF